jgi:hypothetical protein
MASPITPNFEYGLIDGQAVVSWAAYTAAGATTRITIDLPSYAPWIDTRIGHPVLGMVSISDEAATNVTDREIWLPSQEMERGTNADSAGEWEVVDYNTVAVYLAADHNGKIMISYIAFGGQRA